MDDRAETGGPLQIPARTWNGVVQMEDAFRRGFLGPGGGNQQDVSLLPANTVFALRDEGDDDLAELCPVKLRQDDGFDPGGIDPTLRPLDSQRRQLFDALSPEAGDEAEAIGITAEPIPAGRVGKVYITGSVECSLNVTDLGHEFATLTASDTNLLSAASGPARILWKESTATGVQRARVLLNAGSGGGGTDSGFWAEITGSSGGAEPGTLYSWKRKLLDPTTHLYVDAAAPSPLTGTNNLKRAPSATTTAVIPNGHVVRAWPSPTDAGKYETGAPEGYVTDVTCVDGELVVTKG